jgi:hypothetical protein
MNKTLVSLVVVYLLIGLAFQKEYDDRFNRICYSNNYPGASAIVLLWPKFMYNRVFDKDAPFVVSCR